MDSMSGVNGRIPVTVDKELLGCTLGGELHIDMYAVLLTPHIHVTATLMGSRDGRLRRLPVAAFLSLLSLVLSLFASPDALEGTPLTHKYKKTRRSVGARMHRMESLAMEPGNQNRRRMPSK